MNDEEILRELSDLSGVLGELPDVSTSEAVGNIKRMYEESEADYNYIRLNHVGYNEKEYVALSAEYDKALADTDSLTLEVTQLEVDLKRIERQEANFIRVQEENEAQYQRMDDEINYLEERLNNKNLSEEDKSRLNKQIENLNKAKKEIEDNRELQKQRIEAAGNKKKEIEENLSSKKTELQSKNELSAKLSKDIETLKAKGYEEALKTAELNTQTLYFAYNFYSSNPKEEIDKTIKDYKEGLIDSRVLNERLQNLKVLLNSGVYNIDDIKNIDNKLRERKIKEVEEEYKKQLEFVRKENNIEYYEELAKKDPRFKARYDAVIEDLLLHGKGTDRLTELEMLHKSLLATDKVAHKGFAENLDDLIAKTGGEVLVEKEGREVPDYFPEEVLQILDVATVKKANEQIEEKIEEEVQKAVEEQKKEETSPEKSPELIVPEEMMRRIKENAKKKSKEVAPKIVESAKHPEKPVNLDGEKVEVKNVKEIAPEKASKIKEFFKKHWKKAKLIAGIVVFAVTFGAVSLCAPSEKLASSQEEVPTDAREFQEDEVRYQSPNGVEVDFVNGPEVTPAPVLPPVPETPAPEVTPEPEETPVVEETPAPTKPPHKPSTPTPTPDPESPTPPPGVPDSDMPSPGETPTPAPETPTPTPAPTPTPTYEDPEMDGTDGQGNDNEEENEQEETQTHEDPEMDGTGQYDGLIYDPVTGTYYDPATGKYYNSDGNEIDPYLVTPPPTDAEVAEDIANGYTTVDKLFESLNEGPSKGGR